MKEDVRSESDYEHRVDGIFATGLDERNELKVDHQPIFNSIGKSMPELSFYQQQLHRTLLQVSLWRVVHLHHKGELRSIA